VNEGVPIVQGAPRSVAADRFAKLSVSAFGADGTHAAAAAAAAAAEERKSGGRFSFRRR
jgi:hypothetical protein